MFHSGKQNSDRTVAFRTKHNIVQLLSPPLSYEKVRRSIQKNRPNETKSWTRNAETSVYHR